MVYNMTTKSNSLGNVVGDNQAALYKVAEPDAFAGRDKEAIDVVRNYKVLAPEYIDAVHDAIANGRSNVDVEMKQESIDDLVESQFLEKHIGMTSLKRGQSISTRATTRSTKCISTIPTKTSSWVPFGSSISKRIASLLAIAWLEFLTAPFPITTMSNLRSNVQMASFMPSLRINSIAASISVAFCSSTSSRRRPIPNTSTIRSSVGR